MPKTNEERNKDNEDSDQTSRMAVRGLADTGGDEQVVDVVRDDEIAAAGKGEGTLFDMEDGFTVFPSARSVRSGEW